MAPVFLGKMLAQQGQNSRGLTGISRTTKYAFLTKRSNLAAGFRAVHWDSALHYSRARWLASLAMDFEFNDGRKAPGFKGKTGDCAPDFRCSVSTSSKLRGGTVQERSLSNAVIQLQPLALPPQAAAQFLSVSKRFLSRLIAAGKIVAHAGRC